MSNQLSYFNDGIVKFTLFLGSWLCLNNFIHKKVRITKVKKHKLMIYINIYLTLTSLTNRFDWIH